jgi:pimeloyl-ACP methyl ester carboxylesterase
MQKYTFCACLCALVLLVPVSASASTYINATDPSPSGVWDAADSPYIINGDVTVSPTDSFTIEPGTVIEAASPGQGSLFLTASSSVNGTADKPIVIKDLPYVMIGNGITSIAYVNFLATELEVMNATATIDHVSSSGADTAFFFRKSAINMTNSSISSSTYGIYSYYAGPVLMDAQQGSWTKFLSHFLSFLVPAHVKAQTTDDPSQNHITIHNSSFQGTQYAIYNATTNIVHAESDWWGSNAGPSTASTATTSAIYGPVSYVPWIGQATSTAKTCCSNVLFVPGLEASRLAIDNKRVFGTSTEQLWEPISNLQVQSLYLDSSGNSIQSNIHPSGLVDNALAIQPIYQKFISTMNDLVGNGTIKNWQSYPYDWRLALTKASVGTLGTSSVIQAIESMASSSKTGKVTIIAHSNGGLVTKLLYNQLKDKGEVSLVDKIIFVAVPEVGTPQALPSLLHGDGEEIANGLILSASTARGLGVNMPSAYSLLPDQNYFSAVPQAIISFASSTMAGLNFSKYFPAVTSYSKMKSFVDDSSHGSLSDSTNIPVQGNPGLFPQAESVHNILDSWKPATSTQLVAIAGWGLPTDIGVNYFQKIVCALDSLLQKKCAYELEREDINNSGDGTVILGSASYSSSTKQFFNLGSYDTDTNQGLAHADILEADPVENAIKEDIGVASSSTDIPYITSAIPINYKFPDDLVIDVHSPVNTNIYDKYENHTGPIGNPIPGSDLDAYENKIPGSFYKETGDGIEVILPFSPDYKIDLDGTGMGGVTVDTRIENYNDGTEKDFSSFEGMIVTPITHMEFAASTSTSEIDSYKIIKIDEDGDGVFDATSTPNSMPNITADMYKQSIGDCIRALHLKSDDEKNMLNRLDKAWKFAQNDKSGKAEKALKNIDEKRIRHLDPSKITDQNRTEMRGMIENMLDDMGV